MIELELEKIREQIQEDLLTWALDKDLDDNDKNVMCQIIVDNFAKIIK